MAKENRRSLVLLAMLIVLASAFRLHQIDVIPAWNSDEGRWALGGTSLVHYNDFLRGGWSYGFVSPTWTSMICSVFMFAGASIVHARYLTIVLSIIAVWLTYTVGKRCGYSNRISLLAATFLAFNTPFVLVNRQALADTALTTALLASFHLFLGSARQRLLSPLLLALAVGAKATGVFGALVFYVVGVRTNYVKRRGFVDRFLRPAVIPSVAVVLSTVVFFCLYNAYPQEFTRAWGFELSLRQSASAVFYNPFAKDGLVNAIKFHIIRMPIPLAISVLGVGLMLKDRTRNHLFVLAWLASGVMIVAVQNSQPARYYAPVLPSICLIAAWTIDRLCLSSGAEDGGSKRRRLFGYALAAIIPLFTVCAWYGYYNLMGHCDSTGRDVTNWLNANLPRSAVVMGIANYGTGLHQADYLPQESYCRDFYLSDGEIEEYGITHVVYDMEWKFFAEQKGVPMAAQLERRFVRLCRIGSAEVWAVKDQ